MRSLCLPPLTDAVSVAQKKSEAKEKEAKDDAAKTRWAAGWCCAGIEVEILDPLYTGAKGSVLELLNDDEAVVLMHGLSEVFTFDVAKIKAQRPQPGDKCVARFVCLCVTVCCVCLLECASFVFVCASCLVFRLCASWIAS